MIIISLTRHTLTTFVTSTLHPTRSSYLHLLQCYPSYIYRSPLEGPASCCSLIGWGVGELGGVGGGDSGGPSSSGSTGSPSGSFSSSSSFSCTRTRRKTDGSGACEKILHFRYNDSYSHRTSRLRTKRDRVSRPLVLKLLNLRSSPVLATLWKQMRQTRKKNLVQPCAPPTASSRESPCRRT